MLALASLAVLALFLVSATTVNALWPLPPATRHLVMAGACALLLPLLALPYGAGGILSRRPVPGHQPLDEASDAGADEAATAASSSSSLSRSSSIPSSLKDKADLEQPLLQAPPQEQLLEAVASNSVLEARAADAPLGVAALPPELGPLQCLASPDFWLLFAVVCVGTGSGAAACM